jgi:Cu/Ag efflux pump CusA
VVVRGVAATQRDIDSVRNLLIDTPSGGTVRVGDVATVNITPDPVDIQHDATSRYVDLRLETPNRDPGSVRDDVKRRIKNVAYPLAYHAEVLGASGNGQTSHGHFVAYVIAALIGILLLLQAALGSWPLGFAVFLALPLATVGGLIVALVSGHWTSLGAVAGLLAVAGLALRSAIAYITRYERVMRVEGSASEGDVARRVAGERFAPTLAGGVITALIALPFALVGHTAGNEVTQPLAEVILGGVVTVMLVNLFVVPAICLAFGTTALGRTPEAELAELEVEGET